MYKNTEILYKRILLKLSGEFLQGANKFGIDAKKILSIVNEIKFLVNCGIEIGIVVGGGNLFRGSELKKIGISSVISDNIGMLSTIMNGLAIRDIMNKNNINACLMSAVPINGICMHYDWKKAMDYLSKKKVVIFVAGIGNTNFTTDTAACLRGIEMHVDIVLKGTKVNGVYSCDPEINLDAKMYKKLTYQEVLDRKLQVMDLVSIILAKDNNLPIRVFNINKPGILYRIITGEKEGTLII
ncbi:UMP kinase [Buchnera aphidicola (Mollitrichosiphum nigrofasciatum)]|uniref:UMP kinase n=1 Tax=Buchnera aphidicola TaxID=9 RepID=UPI0031B86681